jgi:hypothetical protein
MQIVGGVGGVEKLPLPTLSATTSAAGSFSFTITNYSASNTYVVSTTNGSVSQASGTVTNSGLSSSASAVVTVYATRVGFINSDNVTASGSALPTVPTPTFSTYVATIGGFTTSISNYDAAVSYTVSVSAGSYTNSSGALTITGIGNNASAVVTVTGARSGYVSASASYTGYSKTLAAPTISSVSSAYTQATVYFATDANATSYYVEAIGKSAATVASSPATITGLTNYSSYNYRVTATNAAGSIVSATYGPVTVEVPCPYGTYVYTSATTCSGYPSFGGACCSYPIICDGAGGLTSGCANGPCSVSTGVYCAGCCGPT